MMKPAEKIEHRINNISGFAKSGGSEGSSTSARSSVNNVIDGVLDLAYQLPVKKIGEEVGLNNIGLKGLSESWTALPLKRPIKKEAKKIKTKRSSKRRKKYSNRDVF